MVNQAAIDRLLAEGLTAREAGRLAVRELYALDLGEGGVLSERDLGSLETALRNSRDGEQYRSLIDTYETVRTLTCEAQVVCLKTEALLDDLSHIVEHIRTAELLALYEIVLEGEEDEAESTGREPAAAEAAGAAGPQKCSELAGRSLPELLELLYEAARVSAAVLLAYLQVIGEAGAVLGVDLARNWPSTPRALDCLSGPRPDEDCWAASGRRRGATTPWSSA